MPMIERPSAPDGTGTVSEEWRAGYFDPNPHIKSGRGSASTAPVVCINFSNSSPSWRLAGSQRGHPHQTLSSRSAPGGRARYELLPRLTSWGAAHIRGCHRPGIGDVQSHTGCKHRYRNRNYDHRHIDRSAYDRPAVKDHITLAALRSQRRQQLNSAY